MSQGISPFGVRSLTGAVIIFVSATNLLAAPGDCHDSSNLCTDEPCPCELACIYDQDCPSGMVCSLSAFAPPCCYCNSDGQWDIPCDGSAYACVPAPVRTKPPIYTIKDLGTLGGATSVAHAINNKGQVVGEAQNASGYPHAFFWDGDSMIDLDPEHLASQWSAAYDVNNFSQVMIWNGGKSAVWNNGDLRPIQGFGMNGTSDARAISDAGTVVGSSYDPKLGHETGFYWRDGIINHIDGISPRDINNLGQIAGSIDGGGGQAHAGVWDGKAIVDLGTLGGQYSYARALNDQMHVVGDSERAPGGDRRFFGFLWQGESIIDIAKVAGAEGSIGWGLNNCDVIVSGGAAVFHLDFGFQLLEELIDPELRWYQFWGEGINDYGQIAGSAVQYGIFLRRAILMTPIRGDMNRDGDVDLQDFARMQLSFKGTCDPEIPDCERADIDRDADVDLSDLSMLGARLNGPGQAPPIQ